MSFFGNISKKSTLVESDEGSLEWVGCMEVPKQNVSATTIEIVKHYKEIGKSTESVYIGSMRSLEGRPKITWGILEDWEPPNFG